MGPARGLVVLDEGKVEGALGDSDLAERRALEGGVSPRIASASAAAGAAARGCPM